MFLTSSENLLNITEISLEKKPNECEKCKKKKVLKSHSDIIILERLPNREFTNENRLESLPTAENLLNIRGFILEET